jgi:hypothetical protein
MITYGVRDGVVVRVANFELITPLPGLMMVTVPLI